MVLVDSPSPIVLLAIAALALFGPLLWRLRPAAGAPASLASDTDAAVATTFSRCPRYVPQARRRAPWRSAPRVSGMP